MNESIQDDSDPFNWDTRRLAQELCSSEQPWFPQNPRKFPPLNALLSGLQDDEVDGEAFLTYDSVAPMHELLSAIGISKAYHRLNMYRALDILKQRSPAYQQWKGSAGRADSACVSELESPSTRQYPYPPSFDNNAPPASNGTVHQSPSTPISETLDFKSRELEIRPAIHAGSIGKGSMDARSADKIVLHPPSKKRRIAPTSVSSDAVVRTGLFHVPTEADAIEKKFSRPGGERRRRSKVRSNEPAAYIGPEAIRYEDMISNGPGLEASTSNKSLSWGHKLRVNRAMKALLSGNRPRVTSMVETFRNPIDPDSLLAKIVNSGGDHTFLSDDDSVLAPFGQESGDDEIDSQTAREMEQEAADVERESRQRRVLTKDEVNEEIEDAIKSLVNDWTERKLPTLERKAHRIWAQARQDRSLRQKLRSSTEFLEHLNGRIAKARQEILDNSWSKPQAVGRQAKCLEQSIFDREYHSWLIETLNGPMPPKPIPIARSLKVKRNLSLDEDGEVLTSDSSDSMDDFIAESDDENLMEQGFDLDDIRSAGFPFETVGRDVIDLTFDSPGSEARPEPSHVSRENKTLLTGHGPAESDVEMASGGEGSGADVGLQKTRRAIPDLVWQSVPTGIDLSDDERRLIERLWRIGKPARDQIYDAAKGCDEPMFWDNHIIMGLNPKTPIEHTSAMIARLFLYFAQPSTTFHQAVFNKVRRKTQYKVRDKRDCAGQFLEIISRVIPALPETVELSQLAGGEEGDDGQVIVDSRALQLRQQDQARVEAQDKRRAELREKIALYESIPKDESRLIVNETKEEDEGLILIRGEPARLIKDHQVEGVRFLWNRVIASRDSVRHGCVLAHSMGLGKSMQVITFLLAIIHASRSSDETIRSQVPEDLRDSRTLILCPANLSQNWRDELLTWDAQGELGHVYLVASSQKNMTQSQNRLLREDDIRKWAVDGGVLILGYELFVSFTTRESELADIIATKAAIAIADEAHTIKNPFSKRRRACAKIVTPAKIALTGSPLANNVTEYYSMVDWVAPQYMGSLDEFTNVYATPIQKGLYKDPDLVTKRKAYVLLRVLRKNMAPKVHRCGISVLREQLQPKQEFMLFLPMTDVQRSLYNAFVDEVASSSTSSAQSYTWGAIGNLTLICMHPLCFKKKVDEVLKGNGRANGSGTNDDASVGGAVTDSQFSEDVTLTYDVAKKMQEFMSSNIDDIFDIQHSWRFRLLFAILDGCRAVGDKVLIFSRRKITLDFLEEMFRVQNRTWLRLDGKTPMLDRLGMIKSFNNEKSGAEIFLISTKAGGMGLNIHGANRVIIMDFAHNPMDEQQAIGRAYRIGQEKPVFVYWFVSWGTHEAKLQSRLVYKKQLADRVVEGKDYIPWAAEDGFESWVQNVWDTSPQRPLPRSEAESLVGVDSVLDGLASCPEMSRGIKSIVTTDTFEVEEDPEDVRLTAEEDESVTRLVQEAQRRLEEPSGPSVPPAVASDFSKVPGAVLPLPVHVSISWALPVKPINISMDGLLICHDLDDPG